MKKIDLNDKKTFGIFMGISIIILILLCTVGWNLAVGNNGDESQLDETVINEDVELQAVETEEETGVVTEVVEEEIERVPDIKELPFEVSSPSIGIDVSHYQGNIDWEKVAGAGIEFAMIRVGVRSSSSGEIEEDECARYNLQEAIANGIQVGAYFFSSATTEEEVLEEVTFLCDILDGYGITYPVAFNCENYDSENSRQYGMSVEERTSLANYFLEEVENRGYVGMFYASKSEMTDDLNWMASELELNYKIWVAQYKSNAEASISESPEYSGEFAVWQYTNQGTVEGIDTDVDMNIAYFSCSNVASPLEDGSAIIVDANLEVGVEFEEVNESVTPKEEVNVRSTMDQDSTSNVIGSLINGDVVTRTGIGDNGWSRIEYNGGTAYVVSQYVTTDLDYTIAAVEDDGFDTVFTTVSEQVTAKEVTNLRNRPSIESPSEVVTQLTNGQVATRTGTSNEGWSRVEYNGQVLYCISSYLTVL
ncbi:MAG: GH25 family lysozyme [Eubacteriales bacterium]